MPRHWRERRARLKRFRQMRRFSSATGHSGGFYSRCPNSKPAPTIVSTCSPWTRSPRRWDAQSRTSDPNRTGGVGGMVLSAATRRPLSQSNPCSQIRGAGQLFEPSENFYTNIALRSFPASGNNRKTQGNGSIFQGSEQLPDLSEELSQSAQLKGRLSLNCYYLEINVAKC